MIVCPHCKKEFVRRVGGYTGWLKNYNSEIEKMFIAGKSPREISLAIKEILISKRKAEEHERGEAYKAAYKAGLSYNHSDHRDWRVASPNSQYWYVNGHLIAYILKRLGHAPYVAPLMTEDEKKQRIKKIMNMRASGMTWAAIGKKFNISKSRASQIVETHLRKTKAAQRRKEP